MRAAKIVETIKYVETIGDMEELKQENGSSSKDNLIVKGTFKCILSFINAFFNLMTVIFKGSPGFIWGIIFLFAFKAALSQAAPTSTNDVSTQTSLSNISRTKLLLHPVQSKCHGIGVLHLPNK